MRLIGLQDRSHNRAPGRLDLTEHPSNSNVLPLGLNVGHAQVVEHELVAMRRQAPGRPPDFPDQLPQHLLLMVTHAPRRGEAEGLREMLVGQLAPATVTRPSRR